MKIYQVFESYPLFYQPYIPPVIDALRKVEGVDIKIVAYKGKSDATNESIVLPGYKVRNVFVKIARLLNKEYRDLDYLEIIALKQKVSIIHFQHSFLFNKVINLLKRPPENRPKIIITLRGGDTYVKPWLDTRWRDFYKNYGNKVDAFIAMSEHQRNFLHTKWGVEKQRIHVIPISFGEKKIYKSKLPRSKKIKIVSIFRMCWEKNIDGNLRTIKHLVDLNFSLQYDIYGSGTDAGQVWYLIDKYQLSEHVNFYGKIENNLLKERLPYYDVLLQLSLSDAFPTTVVEAQSIGIPVVVSNTDGLPEAMINGRTGFAIDPNDIEMAANMIIAISKDQETYKNFSAEAHNYVNENFAVEHEVKRISKLYRTLLN